MNAQRQKAIFNELKSKIMRQVHIKQMERLADLKQKEDFNMEFNEGKYGKEETKMQRRIRERNVVLKQHIENKVQEKIDIMEDHKKPEEKTGSELQWHVKQF